MKQPVLFLALTVSLSTLTNAADSLKKDFESDPVAAAPAGFEFARTGGGAEGKWIVRIERGADRNHVLVQESADANNYYITRCNADEDNCTIYHTVKGSRRAFLNQGVKVAKNTWHTLKVEATGNHFVVTYDGKKVLDARDETFKDAGKVGLWTKADSVIEFDDFTVEGR